VSSPRRTILVVLLLTMIGALLPAAAATAADGDPDLRVAIESLDPSTLTQGADVTMTGTVTNRDDHPWTTVQAYFVIPTTPFTTRAQIEDATAGSGAYTGTRVVEPGTFDEIGDLAPGQTSAFSITVPYEQLRITGADGVYPVGVQMLATDDEGTRSQDAVGSATTFLPLISSDQESAPTSAVWPFLMPDHRGPDGTYADPAGLLASVSVGGQLRNLLDLAGSSSVQASTILVDPALLVGVDDLAEDLRGAVPRRPAEHGPDADDVDPGLRPARRPRAQRPARSRRPAARGHRQGHRRSARDLSADRPPRVVADPWRRDPRTADRRAP
jgi:hypothetical protein